MTFDERTVIFSALINMKVMIEAGHSYAVGLKTAVKSYNLSDDEKTDLQRLYSQSINA